MDNTGKISIGKIQTEQTSRGLVCMFCGEGFGYVGQTPTSEELERAYNHEKECPNNPYLKRIAELEGEMGGLLEVVCDMCRKIIPQHAECTSCPDMESWKKALAGKGAGE